MEQSATIATSKHLKGCEFIIKEDSTDFSFGSEDFTEEQEMIRDTVRSFVTNDIMKNVDRLEKLEEGLNASLMKKLGDLGMFGSHMPEEYGGMNLDFNSNSIIGEEMGRCNGFSVSYNAHVGIGMLPILYFGSEEIKAQYLPKLITGEWIGAYCLTEPSSGSDALSAKTRADLSDDGEHYILNGQKMWISNAGFAEVFTVFAQVDGDKFTGFLVERNSEGLTFGEEEKKLGIKASSTRQVFLENVKVPTSHILGEIGKGHLIAFNVLNVGRYKLGLSCLGGAKMLCTVATQYANERIQFKVPISSFGAIKQKLAQMVRQTYECDSVTYRVSNLINEEVNLNKELGKTFAEAKLLAAEEYALECSIIKILGSETVDYCVDEAVQIHGGMGYSEEGLVARAYRDARINRIFEGTNEINRMLMVNIIFKRVMKGELDLMTPAMAIKEEFSNNGNGISSTDQTDDSIVQSFKKCLIMVLGLMGQEAMSGKMDLKAEQEILMNVANMITAVYRSESTLLRIKKNEAKQQEGQEIYQAILKTCLHEAAFEIQKNAIEAVSSFKEEKALEDLVYAIRKFTKIPFYNIKNLNRIIADSIIEKKEYLF